MTRFTSLQISGLRITAALALLAVTACDQAKAVYPERKTGDYTYHYDDGKPRETIFGEGGLFSSGSSKTKNSEGPGIGVNAYLWRASLDTVAFMPLASADPFGGVILTDWYSPPESPQERFKANILIMDRTLRADGLKVALFRQEKKQSGEWVDAPTDAKAAIEMENAILTRARQLRINAGAQN